jgi:hypothetical protein
MASERENPTPAEQVARLYEQAEAQAAQAGERLVGSRGFAGLLGQLAENAAAVNRLSTDALDLVLRNLRVAGRRDVVRLSRQLARTEDKLERVLQEVEQLRDELAARSGSPIDAGAGDRAAPAPRAARSTRRASSARRATSNGAAPAQAAGSNRGRAPGATGGSRRRSAS